MKVLKESGKRYGLTNTGVLVDGGGIPLDLEFKQGEWKVKLVWVHGIEEFTAAKIVLIISRSLSVEPGDIESMKIFYRDEDRNNIHPNNLDFQYWPSLECKYRKGYYHVPGFHRFVISRSGEILNVDTMVPRTWSITKSGKKGITGGYAITGGIEDSGKRRLLSRHRALSLCFKESPSAPIDLVVNHIDGIPGNDSLDNLEWNTYSENTLHAYANGLHPNKISKCQSKNWKTGEELTFEMVADCIRHFGLPEKLIWSRIMRGGTKKFSDGLVFRRYTEEPWNLDDEITPVRLNRPIFAKNVFTDEILVFANQRETGEYMEIDDGLVHWYLSTKSMIPKNGFIFRYGKDLPWPVLDKYQIELARRNPNSRATPGLLVRDDNGETLYNSAEEAAKSLKISRYALNHNIKKSPEKYFRIFPNKPNRLQ